ncbi:MAG: transposase [Bacteroidetes bacterium]|nr:transposase [Bacteroidota bacterium]
MGSYLKQPFSGLEQVVEYLGRYSHKSAISNHRLKSITDGSITFSYKDYKDGSKTKMMTLEADEFLRRFCMHILPPRFMKIRHYGFLANRGKKKLKILLMTNGKIPVKPIKLNYKQVCKQLLKFDVDECPVCKKGRMITLLNFSANAPQASKL